MSDGLIPKLKCANAAAIGRWNVFSRKWPAQDGYSAEPLSVKGEALGTHCSDQPAGVGCF